MEKDTSVHMTQPLICDEGSEKFNIYVKEPTLFIQFISFSNPKILNFFKNIIIGMKCVNHL